jgi:hypothetical protein
MVCAACGCAMVDGVHFCKACGARVMEDTPRPGFGQQAWMPLGAAAGAVPPPPAYAGYMSAEGAQRQRVRQNVQALGMAWCVWGAYRMVAGIVAYFAVHAMEHTQWFGDSAEFMSNMFQCLLPFIAFGTTVMAGLSVLTGYGLLTRRSWGRPLAIVMGIISLIKIPLGTALGIYTLWVLGPKAAGAEYEVLAAAADGVRVQA